MPLDAPIVIRLLELLTEGPSSIQRLGERVAADAGHPLGDVPRHLLVALREEECVGWTITVPGSAARVANLRDLDEHAHLIVCSLDLAGRRKLEAWRRFVVATGATFADEPWEHQPPVRRPPGSPSARMAYALWDGACVLSAPTPRAADEAVCAFAALLAHVGPVVIIDDDSAGIARRRVRYEIGRRWFLHFDADAVQVRGTKDADRVDIPWTDVRRVGERGSDLAFNGPFFVLETWKRATLSWEIWGAAVGELADFVRSFPGAWPTIPQEGNPDRPWFWDAAERPLPDMKSAYAAFWSQPQVEARKQERDRRFAAAIAEEEVRKRKVAESAWRWMFWDRLGLFRVAWVPVGVLLVLGLTPVVCALLEWIRR
jgi:hypothetical protein